MLSSTERSGHCGAISSDHWSWHSLATSEGDKVISYTVCREQESWPNSTSVNITLLMSFSWCHSVDVHWECHFVDVTLSKLISWFHFIDITLKISLCWCHFVDVSLLMSLCWCQSVDITQLTIRYVNELDIWMSWQQRAKIIFGGKLRNPYFCHIFGMERPFFWLKKGMYQPGLVF